MKQLFWIYVGAFFLTACSQSNLKDLSGIASVSKTNNSAVLTLEQGTTVDYGMTVVGNTESKILTIANTGSVTASNIAAISFTTSHFIYTGTNFPGVQGTCTQTLPPGSQCNIEVMFKPLTTLTSFNDQLQISYIQNNVENTLTATLTAWSQTAANLVVSGASAIDFSPIALGNTENQFVTVTNTGQVPATQLSNSLISSSVFNLAGGTYPGTGGTCGTTLAPASSCTLSFSFNPSVASSLAYTTISQLNYQNGYTSAYALVNLSGIGLSLANLVFSNTSYNFGSLLTGNPSSSLTLSLNNQGGIAATNVATSAISSPFSYAGSVYPGTAGTCGTTIQPSATCTIVVNFNPLSLGVSTSAFSLSYGNGLTNQISSTSLTGSLEQPAILTISNYPTYNFGSVVSTLSASETFTVSNSGNLSATGVTFSGLSGAYSFLGGAFPGIAGTCGSSLAAGASCSIVVSFLPTIHGTNTGSLSINYSNGASTANTTLGLTGIMQSPALLSIAGSPSFNYGALLSSTILTHLFTVTNSGDVSATNLSLSGLVAPFTFVGGSFPGTGGNCVTTLLAAASCQLAIVFTPTVRGVSSGGFSLSYSTGLATTSTPVSLLGTMNLPAALSISNSPSYSFTSSYVNSLTPNTFTITNTGDVTATGLLASGLVSPFIYVGGSYPGTGGTCVSSLPASSTCKVVVEFNPLSTGTFNDTLSFQYNNGSGTQLFSEALSGNSTFSSGSINTAFGTAGVDDLNPLNHGNSYVKKLGIESDGTIVAVGSAFNGTDLNIITGKFDQNGNPLISYGTAGFQSLNMNDSNYYGTGISFDSYSNIYVVGNSTSSLVLSKVISATGLLDSTFASAGENLISLMDFGVTGTFPSLTVESAGSFIISGSCGQPGWSIFCIASLNNDGSVNSNFASGGILSTINFGNTNDYLSKTITQSSDDLISAGSFLNSSGLYNIGLVRYTPLGVMDTTFGIGGYATFSISSGNQYLKNIIRLPNDEMLAILLAQNGNSSYDLYAMKITENGALDTTFNSTGFFRIDSWGNTATADFGLDIQSDGKYVIGGYKSNGTNFNQAVARLTTAGILDTTFGTNGEQVISNVQSTNDSNVDLVVHPSGYIIIGGKNQSGSNTLMSLRELNI